MKPDFRLVNLQSLKNSETHFVAYVSTANRLVVPFK